MMHSVHPITALSLGEAELGMSNTIAANTVINKIIELTDNYEITHVVSYMRDFDGDSLMKQYVIDDGDIAVYYTGLTANPTLDDMALFTDIECIIPDRNNLEIMSTWEHGRKVHLPFRNVNKQKIAEIYDHLGITDTLFPVTVSCTKNTDGTHCDNCWWCSERKWAFGRLV